MSLCTPENSAIQKLSIIIIIIIIIIKGSKERLFIIQKNAYLLGQTHYLQMFGVIPFVKLQNDT